MLVINISALNEGNRTVLINWEKIHSYFMGTKQTKQKTKTGIETSHHF